MAIPPSCSVHPTAIVSSETELGRDVKIGPYCIIEGRVKLGDRCVLKGQNYLTGSLTMGCDNTVYPGAILGEAPQHSRYAGEETLLEIGDRNIIRENVTIHRGTTASGRTIVGSNNFFMAGSHVAHDCVVGSNCILANNALLGGHCKVDDYVFVSGNAAVHQFVRLGRFALLSGCAGTSKDIPPFIMQRGYNVVVGVNVVGMRRGGFSARQITGVRRAYQLLFRSGTTVPVAIRRAEEELGDIDTVRELLEFCKSCSRGIALTRSGAHHSEAA